MRDAAGVVVAAGPTATNGAAGVAYVAPAAGAYSVEYVNGSPGTAAPGLTVTSSVPDTRYGQVTLRVKDPTGVVIATGTGAAPHFVAVPVSAAGVYTLEATAAQGRGTATVAGSFPGRDATTRIDYDANDHAVRVADGTRVVAEVVAPSGRVLRSTVTDPVTGVVVRDDWYGYADGGDSPAYTRPVAGGPVTTQVRIGGGLGAVDVGGTVSYQHANAHGDIVGTSDAAGAWTPAVGADEFGHTTNPATYGWLGHHQRPTVGAAGLYRMGVRLYDPALGRFTSIDPIEGGCANDYVYVFGDPVNSFDLDGTHHSRDKEHPVCKKIHGLAKDLSFGQYVRALNQLKEGNYSKALEIFRKAIMGDVKGGLLSRSVGLIKAAAKVAQVVNVVATYVDGMCALDTYARQRKPKRARS